MRLTLAVVFVTREEKAVDVVQRLHERLESLDLNIRVLYLDRGFCSGTVIALFHEKSQPFVMACTVRGKQGGTRQLCRGRKSYCTAYTFTNGTTADMAVVATLRRIQKIKHPVMDGIP